MKFIARGWDSYRSAVIPNDAPDIQVKETRQAFFAGAAILFQTLMLALDPEAEPTDADMQRMDDLQTELNEFGHYFDKRAFGKTEH